MIRTACAVVFFLASAALAQSLLTKADYLQIGAVILKAEAEPTAGPWTIFVGFSDIEAKDMAPAFQKMYQRPTIVKGSGEDWGTKNKDGCHFDKATGSPAAGVFISSPDWRKPDEVAFSVTFTACSIGMHINTYVFLNENGQWKVKNVERGPIT